MIRKHNLFRQPLSVQKKLLVLVAAAILIALVVGAGRYFLGTRNSQFIPSSNQPTSIFMISPTSSADMPTMNTKPTTWKTFTAPIEGFTLRYPDTWIVEDETLINCGYKYNTGIPDGRGSYCKDSFNFVAPDGLLVRYVLIGEAKDDRAECGTQSVCGMQQVDEIETVSVNGLEDILLVKRGKFVDLHKPLNSGTIPVVGENKHPNYDISFSLPAKTGGRFSLSLTPFDSMNPKLRDELTNEQYYNQDSVKQGLQILKSLEYPPPFFYQHP
jgi:hypothetical protein